MCANLGVLRVRTLARRVKEHGSGERDSGHEGVGAPVVAGGDPAVVLQAAEHDLNLLAQAVVWIAPGPIPELYPYLRPDLGTQAR